MIAIFDTDISKSPVPRSEQQPNVSIGRGRANGV